MRVCNDDSLVRCATAYSTDTTTVSPATPCVKQQTSPSSLSATSDVIPVTRSYHGEVNPLISPDKTNTPPSTPRRFHDTSDQLSGSDSDDPGKTAPPHSLLPIYSSSQLRDSVA